MGDDDPVGTYVRTGRGHRELLDDVLPDNWSWSGRRVLDFGCGVGRVLRHFAPEAKDAEFWGCDIDRASIAWLRGHLSPPFHVFECDETPGLPQDDGYFDLIYAFSVYTHLTDDWAGWLLEHHRVLADGGLLFATFLGEGMIQELTGEVWDENRIGMNTLSHGNPWDGGGPITLHSPWWLRAHWGRAFEILDLRPHTGEERPSGHGFVLMRKRPVQLTVDDLKCLEASEPREITAMQHHVKQLRDETIRIRDTLAHATQDAAQARQENARLSEALTAMRGSASWRLTTPLRAAKRRLRRTGVEGPP